MPENNSTKILRTKANLTRKQLAERLGVSVRTVEGWESKRHPSKTSLRLMELLLK